MFLAHTLLSQRSHSLECVCVREHVCAALCYEDSTHQHLFQHTAICHVRLLGTFYHDPPLF